MASTDWRVLKAFWNLGLSLPIVSKRGLFWLPFLWQKRGKVQRKCAAVFSSLVYCDDYTYAIGLRHINLTQKRFPNFF